MKSTQSRLSSRQSSLVTTSRSR